MIATTAEETRTICPYCGVGCGLKVAVRDGLVARVRGDETHHGTRGMLCRKAVYLPGALDTPDRLRFPLLRTHRAGAFRPTGWDAALAWAADELRRIVERHGPDSVAFYISGQLLTEDYYVVNKLAKGFLGTNNVDSNSRLCMASAVSAYQLALGQDGPPCAYAERPFVLNTGRERDQWHTMTRTGKVPQLMKSCPESYLALHPSDAAALDLAEGDWAEVSAPGRGRARFKARITDDVLPGCVFAPFHWGHHWHAGGSLNEITSPAFDPVSKQPELKAAAVRVRRVLRMPPSSS
jgi:anaerobic selenocysteine-containing dehydrogenase